MTPIPKKETKEIDLHNATWELLELHQELRDSEADVAFKKFQDFIRQLLKGRREEAIRECVEALPRVDEEYKYVQSTDEISRANDLMKLVRTRLVWIVSNPKLIKLLTEDSPQKE